MNECICKPLVIEVSNPDRKIATCHYCGHTQLSDEKLPFFRARPTQSTDDFYCGCRGWD